MRLITEQSERTLDSDAICTSTNRTPAPVPAEVEDGQRKGCGSIAQSCLATLPKLFKSVAMTQRMLIHTHMASVFSLIYKKKKGSKI